MRRVLAVGVGPGDPEQVTAQAARALGEADVLFELERETRELTLAREAICRRHLPPGHRPALVTVAEPRRDRAAADYSAAVEQWRTRRADAWEQAIEQHLGPEGCGAFLVWGDPSLYDSTIAVLEQIASRGKVTFAFEVIPGISSLHALTARHRIALNRVGGSVLITTGRRLQEEGWPPLVGDVVVMLDASCSFRRLVGEPLDIYWGAYLGSPDEILLAGDLAEAAPRIIELRERARAQKGWIMDLYLLRRR